MIAANKEANIGLETGRNHYSAFHCGQSWLCIHSEEQQVLTYAYN
jgi:hypothetical protein